MSSSDVAALRAYLSLLKDFVACVEDAVTAGEEKRTRPELVKRCADLLADLRNSRHATLLAGVRIDNSRAQMTELLEFSYNNCENIHLSSDGTVPRSSYVNLMAGVGRYLRELEDLAVLAESWLEQGKTREADLGPNASDPVLSERQYDILEAMYDLKATDPSRRKTTAQIAERAEGKGAHPPRFKDAIADLKSRGLIDTKDGRGGGCWLTATGLALTKRIKDS